MNIHTALIVERNLKHGIQRLLHRTIHVGGIQPADIFNAVLHRLTHQAINLRMQQAVLREGNNFTGKSRMTGRCRLQMFQTFQAADRIDIAMAAGAGSTFGVQQGDQSFGTGLGVRQ